MRHIALIPPGSEKAFAAVLFSLCPRWHACALGPDLGFGAGRVVLRMEYAMCGSHAEAEEEAWRRLEAHCESEGSRPFDPAEWALAHAPTILDGN